MDNANLTTEASGRWKRSFAIIATGQTVSLIGTSAAQFALIWWVASETNSALLLSLAGLLAFLPRLVLGPFAGVWIDRVKRKHIIIAADMFMGLVAGAFALVFLFAAPPYWVACLVLGIRAVGEVFHLPAIQAAVPMLVPEKRLLRANSWSQFLQSGAFMLGPVLGAALYASMPLYAVMLFDIAGAAVASATVAMVHIPDPPREARKTPNLFHEMKEGAVILLRDKRLCVVTVASTLCMLFYLPLGNLYPLMTSDHLKGIEWHASIVEFVYAGGMMAGSTILGARGQVKNHFGVMHGALIGFGAALLLSGLLPANLSGFWPFVALCAIMGAGGTLFYTPYSAYLQRTIPNEAQGRAFSLVGSLMSIAAPLGLLIAGSVSAAKGVASWFFISGVAMLVITLASVIVSAAMGRKGR